MEWYKSTLELRTSGKGLYPITHLIEARVKEWQIKEGMCFLYIPHASASLVINEQYDRSAQADMEQLMERLIPDQQPWYVHTFEGKDDSSSHLRSMLTATSLSIPVDDARLSIGRWQGIFLFEHRSGGRKREIYIRCMKVY